MPQCVIAVNHLACGEQRLWLQRCPPQTADFQQTFLLMHSLQADISTLQNLFNTWNVLYIIQSSTKAYGTRPKFSVQVTGTRISYQKLGSNSACSTLSKFLVPDKSGTNDKLAKLLVRDSGTSKLDRKLGLCAIGLSIYKANSHMSRTIVYYKCVTMEDNQWWV